MEGEKKKYPYGWEEPLIIVLLIMFFLSMIGGIPSFFEEKTGIDSGGFFSGLLGDFALDLDTPIGTKMINVKKGSIYASPGGGEIVGEVPRGAFGEVVGGPIMVDGELWWEVEYENGVRGWVPGSDIEVDADRDRTALKASTPRGTKVEANEGTTVYSSPHDGISIGEVKKGDKGVIIGGPTEVNGERFWQVRFEDGTVGWVAESVLDIDTERNLRGLNDSTLLGTAVKNIKEVDVFNFPRNGRKIGEQLNGALGTLINGPVTISTSRWWEVDYSEGIDGWVNEESLERQFPLADAAKRTSSFFRRLSFFISSILGIGVIVYFLKLREQISREYHAFKPLSVMPSEHRAKNRKWERVLFHLDSDSPNDWKLAIMEADIMLEEMVGTMMLGGSTLGEKLKRVERADFKTIDKAWEAHKVRNTLAHQGGDYILTQREAKRIISLYKDIFDEFHFV